MFLSPSYRLGMQMFQLAGPIRNIQLIVCRTEWVNVSRGFELARVTSSHHQMKGWSVEVAVEGSSITAIPIPCQRPGCKLNPRALIRA